MITVKSREGKRAFALPQHMPRSIYAYAYNAQDSGKTTISIAWEAGKLVFSQICGKKAVINEK